MKIGNGAYNEWEKRITKELKFLFSKEGEELQLCLVAQGYEINLFSRLMVLFGSGFAAVKIIKNLRGEINNVKE